MNASPTGSDAQALIARLDWENSPLGAAGTWPQSLRTAVDIVIHSPMPMLLLWGSQLTQLYNDGFAALAGNKHPEAMGQPARLIPMPTMLLKVGARMIGKGGVAQRLLGNLQVDITHTRKTLGWVPPMTVDEGLKRAAASLQP